MKLIYADYLFDVDQPDHSGAMNATLWEFDLLKNHYSIEIRKWVETVKKLMTTKH